jgi:prephenate dehydratase
VGDAIAALHRVCGDVRYLGSYPRRDGSQAPVLPGRTDGEFLEAREWLRRVRESGRSTA